MSVKDFDPRYLQLWKDSSIHEVVLPVTTREQAINFRQRLYLLRKAMRAEAHPAADAAAKAKIKIEYFYSGEWVTYTNDRAMEKAGSRGKLLEWRLRMIPYDQSFDEVLEKAGYGVPEAPDLN